MATLKFELKLKQVEAELVHPDGRVQEVLICELPGPDVESYQDSIKDRLVVEVTDKGKMKVKDIKTFRGSYEALLKLCLRDKKTGLIIPVEQIQTYPASVQKALFEEAQKLNALDDGAVYAAKNDSKVQGEVGSA